MTVAVTSALPIELPVGFVFLDDGKARFYNAPLMAYLNDKVMRGAVIALDDPWQEEGFSVPSRFHYGQMVFAHELVTMGDYSPFFVPPMPPRDAIARPVGTVLKEGPPPADFLLEVGRIAAAATLHGHLEPFNTAAVVRTRPHMKHPNASSTGLSVRVSLVDDSGQEHATYWLDDPRPTH